MRNKAELSVIDGRRKRSERSRAAIITATLSLIDSGNFAPTARQIAEEAGIGLRSFFRHFEDMDALLDTIDKHTRIFYEPLFDRPVHDGPAHERVEDIVISLSDAYENLKKMWMTTQAQIWRSDSLKKNYARNQQKLRAYLETWLPELKGLPDAQREAAHAVASFETWQRLRQYQNLSIGDARDAIIATLSRLLD